MGGGAGDGALPTVEAVGFDDGDAGTASVLAG